jgi:hypothetical protein
MVTNLQTIREPESKMFPRILSLTYYQIRLVLSLVLSSEK